MTKEMLEDLVAAAFNDAARIREDAKERRWHKCLPVCNYPPSFKMHHSDANQSAVLSLWKRCAAFRASALSRRSEDGVYLLQRDRSGGMRLRRR